MVISHSYVKLPEGKNGGIHFVCWEKLLGLTLQDLQVTFLFCVADVFSSFLWVAHLGYSWPSSTQIHILGSPFNAHIKGVPGTTFWVD